MHITWNLLFITFTTFTVLCNHHQYIVQYIWSLWKKAICPLSSHSSVSQLQLLAPMNLLFLYVDLPILDISHKCNHSVTYFTYKSPFMTGVCSLTCEFSVQVIHVVISVISVHCSLYVRTILHFIYILYKHFCLFFNSWWTFGLFPAFGYCE